MTRKAARVVSKENSSRKGVIIDDYEEDARGRPVKSKPYRKPKDATSRLVPPAPVIPSDNLFNDIDQDAVQAEGNFAGAELDWDNVELDEDSNSSAERKAIHKLIQTPNIALREWLSTHLPKYLAALFQTCAAPLYSACALCCDPPKDLYSCEDCIGHPPVCSKCLVKTHKWLPTHRVNIWNGTWWQRTSLADLGLVLYLGHGGKQCDRQPSHSKLWVGDISGFQNVNVHYCNHPGHPPRFAQLLSVGLFSCSDEAPSSAFTISLLEHFDICSTIGAMSAQKYYNVLVKKTNAGFPHQVPDRYRELHGTHRRYTHLKNCQRSGALYEPHPLEKHQDHAVPCVSCPSPGFNFDPRLVPALLLALFRFWLSYDGNFQNGRKAKKVDKDDICLSDGMQYFVRHGPYELWAKIGGKEREKGMRPECDNHKAGRSDTFGKWGGLDVTGMGLFSCTRHTFVLPRGVVDYYGGEKFRFGDYGFGSVVNYKLREGACTFGMTYDIWCQWIINLEKRAENFPSDVSLPANLSLIGGIPKWHLVGHKPVCAIRYSLNHMKYCGRMDGEGPERFWSYLNETSGSTSEKSPGYRRDSINNIIDSWNFSKLIGIHKQLLVGFREAKKMYSRQLQTFKELDESLPEEVTRPWVEENVEAVLNDEGKWESPLHPAEAEVIGFQETLRQERSRETDDAHAPGRRVGASQWVATGIELEHSMQLVRKFGDELPSTLTDQLCNELYSKKNTLLRKIQPHQEDISLFMAGGDVYPDHPDRRIVVNAEPEHMELGLPSSYLVSTLHAAGLQSMQKLELTLRQAVCEDAIRSLRSLLGAKAATLKFKKANVRGEIATTRAEAKLKEHSKKIAAMQWRYNNSRAALIRLGMTETELEKYQQVTAKDLKYLKSYLDEESRTLGEGYREIPWLWRTSVAGNSEKWQIEALKTEWFRSRERYRRWEEELMLIKRDVVLAHNSFRSLERIWAFKATSTRNLPGMGEYAAKKSHFYKSLGDQIHKECAEVIEDSVVDFDWKEGW